MGWLIALAVIVFIAVLPVGISALYDSAGPRVWVLIGPFRWKVLPSSRKAPQNPGETPLKSPKKKSKSQEKADEIPKKKGGSILDFLPLVQRVLDFLADLRRKLRVRHLQLHLTLAGGDPCDLALSYGKAEAAMANLDPYLERFFVIKKKDIRIGCDFTEEKTLIYGRLDLTITVGRIFSLGFRHGIRILREFFKIMKSRNGGATNEQNPS